MRLKLMGILCFSVLTGCGSSSNLNQIWLGSEDGLDSLITECRTLYDAGDFNGAGDKCDKATKESPNSEEAAILSGYVALSRGGIDPYTLARKLINLDSDKEKSSKSDLMLTRSEQMDSLADLFMLADDNAEKDSSASNSAADSLSKLSSLINLKDSDFGVLGTKIAESEFQTDLFKGNEIYKANDVTPALRENVEVLKYMNRAITKICTFVDESVKIEKDPKGRGNCKRSDYATDSSKAHFLWAFSHLTEALVFQSVLLYQGSSSTTAEKGKTSNFQAAANKLNSSKSDLSEFSKKVDDMQLATDKVFDVSSKNSMLSRTLDALDAVTKPLSSYRDYQSR